MKNTYLLFGEDACIVYHTDEIYSSLQEKADAVKETNHEIFVYDENETPVTLLNAYSGWGDFAIISKQFYDLLNNQS
jgi:hypothetical protein